MVSEQERERAAAPHRHALPAGVVILRHRIGGASCVLYSHPFEVISYVGRVGRAPYLDLHPMIAAVGRRAVQPVAHVAYAAGGEGMRLSGCGLGILSGDGAVEDRRPSG